MGRALISTLYTPPRSRALRLASGAVVLALMVSALASVALAQPGAPVNPARLDHDELLRVVRTLSDGTFQGRRTGTPGGLAARRFIRDAFEEIGLSPAGEDFVQPFTFVRGDARRSRADRDSTSTTYEGANVIGMVPGTSRRSRAIVVSAHYDHLGERGGVTYPGADDNASGVAALLTIARYVRAHPLTHTVIFAAFDAEELDLEGAKAFLHTPPVPTSSIALDVNFDMVSRNDRNEIYAAGTFQNPSLEPIVKEVQGRSSVTIRFGHDQPKTKGRAVDDWTMQSDHGVFHAAGIPFLYFGVEDHPDYHQPSDTSDKINPMFFGNVAEMLADFVITVDRKMP